MAQKTGQEETEFKVVAGNNLCQKCFSTPAAAVPAPKICVFGERSSSTTTARSSPHRILKTKREVNRCSRRVGLTRFRCRCGDLFCADHRYDCSYDYKTAGREAIARENPLVRAAKIVKI
ncbi:zinc finger A20 and AN1 domain-containing stress-associated protein 5-like [Salvia hispanica]|uniref:zinc finger A20 and AN1 domain-containing stress-associated protein 5-like n=1 Tax=Salvia hispanica TaxID=49212 RepID=UPI002009851B|nr:zinc finger A20 and AN1 domain-containing stress-associated protein 5-like [Salvia hispanica]